MDWDDNESMPCGLCNSVESDQNKLLICLYCFAAVHLDCKGIRGVAASRVKKNPYFCSTKCSEIYKRIIDMQHNEKTFFSSISKQLNAAVSSVVTDQMREVKSEVKSITSAVEASQNFLSEKFDKISSDFSDLKTENEKLKLELSEVKDSHRSLSAVVNTLEMNFDKVNRQSVSNNVVILGMPSLPNENVTDLALKTFKQIGAIVTSDSIVSASRFFTRTNNKNNKVSNITVPIRIIFKDTATKDFVLDKKTEFGQLLSSTIDKSLLVNGNGSRIAIREELTAFSQNLLKEMRQSQNILKIKYVWPGRNGTILVKKDDEANVDKITNRDDLIRIINLYKNSESDPISISPSPESPKRKPKKPKKA